MNVAVVGGAEKGLVVLASKVVGSVELDSLVTKVEVCKFERRVEGCGCSSL